MRGKEPLFLCPPAIASNDQYGRWQNCAVTDRTKANKGYTWSELDQLSLYRDSYNVTQFAYWSDRSEYMSNKANWLMELGQFRPVMEPTRHKPYHVDGCLKDIRELDHRVRDYSAKLDAHIESLHEDIRVHLWVTDDFIEPASQSLAETRRVVDTLLTRIKKLEQGYEQFPREADFDADSHDAELK